LWSSSTCTTYVLSELVYLKNDEKQKQTYVPPARQSLFATKGIKGDEKKLYTILVNDYNNNYCVTIPKSRTKNRRKLIVLISMNKIMAIKWLPVLLLS
jgi:hypothetical protein